MFETDENVERGKYNIDHIFSQLEGFKNNIPPFIISSIINLQILSASENSSKGSRCDITSEQLINKFYSVKEK